MDLHLGQDLLDRCHNAKICNNHRINACAADRAQKFAKSGVLVAVRHGVEGEIKLLPSLVGVFSRLVKLFNCKIIRRRAHSKALSCKVDCIRSVKQSRLQLFKITCRGKQFGSFYSFVHFNSILK